MARPQCDRPLVVLGPLERRVSKVQFPRNQFELIWSKLNPWVGLEYLGSLAWFLVLQIGSSPFSTIFYGKKSIDFPSKTRGHVGLASICNFLVLDPRLKALGTNLKLSINKIAWILKLLINKIAWILWSLDLEPSSKVTLKIRICTTTNLIS